MTKTVSAVLSPINSEYYEILRMWIEVDCELSNSEVNDANYSASAGFYQI